MALGRTQHLDGDGHHDLALGGAVARYVAREGVHVGDQLRLLRRGRGAADAPAEGDGLAGDLALEGPEDERGVRGAGRRVEDVEACLGGRGKVLSGRRVSFLVVWFMGSGWDKCLLPAQLTSLLGDGRLLYACHSREAVFARFLRRATMAPTWSTHVPFHPSTYQRPD